MSMFDSLVNLLYPPQCVVCKQDNALGYLCDSCQAKIEVISRPVCSRCGYPLPQANTTCRQCRAHPIHNLDKIRSAAMFNGVLQKVVHHFKYKNISALNKRLAEFLATAIETYNLHADVVVPVPLHKNRYKERGYNQSFELATALSKITTLKVNAKVLTRTRETASQMTLNARDRQQNVAAAFVCRPNQLVQQNILLIDDVCTTGATLEACAGALKAGGSGKVIGLTLGRAR